MVRMRSLMNDKKDDAAFRGSREPHMGMCVQSEFYQSVPFFFTREGAPLNMIGHYRGDSIFIICNGPSFAGLDHSLLNRPGIMTYGMNNGAKSFRPNFWSCVDDPSRFIKSVWLDARITKFVPQAHFNKKIFDNSDQWKVSNIKVGDCPNVIGFRRNEKFVAERFLYEDTINWGNHKDYGGGRSVMLPVFRIAFLLGFRKIYLLGCDFTMTEEYTYHFDEQRTKGAVNCNRGTYDRLQKDYFPALKPVFDKEGVEIYNCNPKSGLKVFPFKSFEDAIKDSTIQLGDVENERTWGMYGKPGEKEEWKEEPKDKANLKVLEKLKKKAVNQKATQNQSTVVKPVPSLEAPKTPDVPIASAQIHVDNVHPSPVELPPEIIDVAEKMFMFPSETERLSPDTDNDTDTKEVMSALEKTNTTTTLLPPDFTYCQSSK